MATKTTQLFNPPLREKLVDEAGKITRPLQKWLFTLQNQAQLKLIDTSAGNYAEALPPAGLNSTTGQSNQNQELIYKKISADGNTFTLTGAPEGPQTLTAQYSKVRLKSDGTSWYVVG